MDWRVASVVCMVMYGVAMFLVAKASPIHGGKVSCFMQGLGYMILLVALGFGRADLARITAYSGTLGVSAAGLLCGGTYLMFHAIEFNPSKTAIIAIITEGWIVITALLLHFTGHPLTVRQWIGVLLVNTGMALILR